VLRIQWTRAGREGLELSARLDAAGNLITRPIAWSVRRAVSASPALGEPVFAREAPVADLVLGPGEYRVEAAYGYVTVAHDVTLLPGQVIGLTLILNVGGLRLLSKVDGVGLPAGIHSTHRVFKLTGEAAGHEVAASVPPGELMRLGAGKYRIESRFSPGNAVAETQVEVKAGILSSVEVSHLAGLARLDLGDADAAWEIRNSAGTWSASGTGDRPALVLAPGSYEVIATIAGKPRSATFAVAARQSRIIRLEE
jgi:hypothetical protein